MKYCSCLPYRGEAVWLKMGESRGSTADDLVEGSNDVNFCMCSSKNEDAQLFGQPLCSWALGIEAAFAIVAGAPVLDSVPCVGLVSGVLGQVSDEIHAVGRVLEPVGGSSGRCT